MFILFFDPLTQEAFSLHFVYSPIGYNNLVVQKVANSKIYLPLIMYKLPL